MDAPLELQGEALQPDALAIQLPSSSLDSMPIFLIMNVIISDIYEIWYIVLGISICFSVGCVVKGLVAYKSKQFS